MIPGFDAARLPLEWRGAHGPVLPGAATTTETIRRAIQHSRAPEDAPEGLPEQLEDGRRVAADLGRRPAHGAGEIRARRCCHPRTRRWWLPFALIRSGRVTTAATHSRPRSHFRPARRCIVASSVTVSAECWRLTATSPGGSASRPTPAQRYRSSPDQAASPTMNGQVEWMNRSIKDAAIEREPYDSSALTCPTSSAPTTSHAA